MLSLSLSLSSTTTALVLAINNLYMSGILVLQVSQVPAKCTTKVRGQSHTGWIYEASTRYLRARGIDHGTLEAALRLVSACACLDSTEIHTQAVVYWVSPI